MLTILADTFRIATLQAPQTPKPRKRPDPERDRRHRESWLKIAGIHL